MKENTKKGVSRREFLGLSALGLASLTILPSWAIDGVRIAPSDRVVLGFIGLVQQALSDFKEGLLHHRERRNRRTGSSVYRLKRLRVFRVS